jgi:hypothetical protein
MPNELITQYLAALRAGDRMAMRRIEVEAAEFDAHNPFGPRLADEIAALADTQAAA